MHHNKNFFCMVGNVWSVMKTDGCRLPTSIFLLVALMWGLPSPFRHFPRLLRHAFSCNLIGCEGCLCKAGFLLLNHLFGLCYTLEDHAWIDHFQPNAHTPCSVLGWLNRFPIWWVSLPVWPVEPGSGYPTLLPLWWKHGQVEVGGLQRSQGLTF